MHLEESIQSHASYLVYLDKQTWLTYSNSNGTSQSGVSKAEVGTEGRPGPATEGVFIAYTHKRKDW